MHAEELTDAEAPIQTLVPTHQETDVDVLIIEDHVNLAKALEWAVRRIVPAGWDVQSIHRAKTGAYVLILDPDIKLAIIDYFLAEKLGDQIVEEAIEARPSLRGKIIMCSGIGTYPPEVEEKLFQEYQCARVDKPVDFEELERAVHKIIGPQTAG